MVGSLLNGRLRPHPRWAVCHTGSSLRLSSPSRRPSRFYSEPIVACQRVPAVPTLYSRHSNPAGSSYLPATGASGSRCGHLQSVGVLCERYFRDWRSAVAARSCLWLWLTDIFAPSCFSSPAAGSAKSVTSCGAYQQLRAPAHRWAPTVVRWSLFMGFNVDGEGRPPRALSAWLRCQAV